MRRQVKIGLALGSGGARGLAHLGVLARLNEWGVKLHCVAGTSIGAIMGAIYASGTVDKAIAWAERLDWAGAATLFAEINMPVTGFFTGRRVEERLRKFIPYGDFSESPVPLATVATDIATGEEVVLRTGDMMEGVRASYAIPGVFTPVERDGRQLVDGGLVNPLPISVCRELGADAVIAVDINLRQGPPGYRRTKKSLKIMEILANTISILENEVTRGTLAAQAPDVCVQPAVGDIFTLDFLTARTAIEAGYAAADERRAEIEALVEGRAS